MLLSISMCISDALVPGVNCLFINIVTGSTKRVVVTIERLEWSLHLGIQKVEVRSDSLQLAFAFEYQLYVLLHCLGQLQWCTYFALFFLTTPLIVLLILQQILVESGALLNLARFKNPVLMNIMDFKAQVILHRLVVFADDLVCETGSYSVRRNWPSEFCCS